VPLPITERDAQPGHYFREKGAAAEKIIHNLATKTFLTDWCYTNPKKPDGNELCDLLVVFDETPIIWQIKDLKTDEYGRYKPADLRSISARERKLHRHLSDRLILIDPADSVVSVGFNPLEQGEPDFVRIAEFAQVLRERWALDHFGARTDELLRNSLYVLAANGLTLLELAPLLNYPAFRTTALRKVTNPEVREYFASRYDQASEAMQASMREPLLNKTSAFTADPHFRHIIGQTHSTFSIREAMDNGYWVIVNLAKGKLGEQALTLGSLILTVIKNALFTREKRSLYTLYCDEIQTRRTRKQTNLKLQHDAMQERRCVGERDTFCGSVYPSDAGWVPSSSPSGFRRQSVCHKVSEQPAAREGSRQ
jgi:hypothetical protein